jgi:hypothetical protein
MIIGFKIKLSFLLDYVNAGNGGKIVLKLKCSEKATKIWPIFDTSGRWAKFL